jgi:hypothetical protein
MVDGPGESGPRAADSHRMPEPPIEQWPRRIFPEGSAEQTCQQFPAVKGGLAADLRGPNTVGKVFCRALFSALELFANPALMYTLHSAKSF